jgi:aminoglycoside 3-N-acetyltransferase
VPGVRRSSHPEVSAAAVGPNADALVGDHPLDDGLGEHSPQGNLYRLDGYVLLLGVGHGNNTSLHLCEQRAAPPGQQPEIKGASMLVDGQRRWVTFQCFPTDESDFVDLGDEFAHTGRQRSGPVGATTAHLMGSRDLVDFGTEWLRRHRKPGTHHDHHHQAN